MEANYKRKLREKASFCNQMSIMKSAYSLANGAKKAVYNSIHEQLQVLFLNICHKNYGCDYKIFEVLSRLIIEGMKNFLLLDEKFDEKLPTLRHSLRTGRN